MLGRLSASSSPSTIVMVVLVMLAIAGEWRRRAVGLRLSLATTTSTFWVPLFSHAFRTSTLSAVIAVVASLMSSIMSSTSLRSFAWRQREWAAVPSSKLASLMALASQVRVAVRASGEPVTIVTAVVPPSGVRSPPVRTALGGVAPPSLD